jgi:hypothetical protein
MTKDITFTDFCTDFFKMIVGTPLPVLMSSRETRKRDVIVERHHNRHHAREQITINGTESTKTFSEVITQLENNGHRLEHCMRLNKLENNAAHIFTRCVFRHRSTNKQKPDELI